LNGEPLNGHDTPGSSLTKTGAGDTDSLMTFRERAILFCGTGCYIGYIPVAPGTFGSVAGIALCLPAALLPTPVAAVLVLAFIGAAVWAAHRTEQILGAKDPGPIVIDEMAGMLVTLVGLAPTGGTLLVGFLLFRLLDIAKPFPIRQLERRLPGGWGVVADDVAAGLLANLLLRLGQACIGSP